jgi:hypothetical protein
MDLDRSGTVDTGLDLAMGSDRSNLAAAAVRMAPHMVSASAAVA